MNIGVKYTEPRLVKGPKPTVIPRGSTLEKEWAKNTWYVNYSFNGKQQRIKGSLNRIKDPKEKAYQAAVLLQSIKNDLQNGYNPEQPELYLEQIAKQEITLAEAVTTYLADIEKYNRKKTVQSYHSKLRYLVEEYPDKRLQEITTKNIEGYIRKKIKPTTPAKINMEGKVIVLDRTIPWTQDTVRAARGVFRAFFNWCIGEQYITENPVTKLDQKKIRSEVAAPERNIPFTKEDLQAIMQYLDTHDRFTAFFGRFIYSTCLRPAEICQLKVKDLKDGKLTIPLSAMKNTKKKEVDTIDIEPNFLQELNNLNPTQYPKEFFITSNNDKTIIGAKGIRPDKPYKHLRKVLKELNLLGKGYNLYSFKHYSNIQRLNSGWTLAEIMKANRHSSIAMTEKYLKEITRQTDISNKKVPRI